MEYQTTPIIGIQNTATKEAGVRLLVKCEYQNHPEVSGNKWWKLKYNLEEAHKRGYKTILTFGGAYSNHIYATAAATSEAGLQSIGIIRGEKVEPLNNTLTFAAYKGMQLHFVSRERYRLRNDLSFLKELHQQFGEFYLIPEGGTNELAVKGCTEFAVTQLSALPFNYLCLPVGTGGTMAGVVCGLTDEKQITGIAVLKQGEFLQNDVSMMIRNFPGKHYGNWQILTSYHHGGYAKVSDELNRFIVSMKVAHNLLLDHVYTAKLMWAVMEEIKKGNFPRGSTILALHTGGLQGSS